MSGSLRTARLFAFVSVAALTLSGIVLVQVVGSALRDAGVALRIREQADRFVQTVKAGEGPDAIVDSFDIDDYTRWRLLEGLDDIGITLGHDDAIAAFESQRPSWKPVTQ